MQLAFTQSALTAHVFPSGHLVHTRPPQSMSLSSWFLIPSLHVGFGLQTPLPQIADWQSLAAAHVFPSAHLGQCVPPQSTSVSSWFLSESVQLGGAVHALLRQV